MPNVKVEFAPTPRNLSLTKDSEFQGYRVKYSSDGGPHGILTLPDNMSSRDVELLMRDWFARGWIVDDGRGLWRYEYSNEYRPAWIPPDKDRAYLALVTPLFEVGDYYDLIGVTDETRLRGLHGRGKVGHVDTWVDRNHPWLRNSEVYQAGSGQDSEGHGTHTLTTLAGEAGICHQSILYTFNALPNGAGSEALVAEGIDWCTNNGVLLITLSLGGTASGVIDQAVYRARQRGVRVFAAAGNSYGRDPIGSPARAATWIVMSCDRGLKPSDFTDGRTWHSYRNRIYGMGDPVVAGFPGGGQGPARGTSMATPGVAGQAALLIVGGVEMAS